MRFAALRQSRRALVAVRAALCLLAIVFFVDAIQSVLVLSRYAVPIGTGMWNAATATGFVAATSGVFAVTLAMNWRWSVWAWAVAVGTAGAVGLALGLNRQFLFRWEMVLPWVLLAACSVLGLKQARPWRHGA